ncbi:3'-5' exonuclease [Candidatus Pacearchaeota archaeon]|nr:3'-5' exonuclease [Candidatus Pacearchaeota archaeon]
MKPIVLDIETSGIDKVKCGIWQIGAYDLNTGEEFLQESRIDDEDEILNLTDKPIFEVIGKTEAELRNVNKQPQKQMLVNFFGWVKQRPMKNFLCQNPQFDVTFLDIKARRYELKIPFHYRSFDLHNIAQTRYFDLNEKFLIKEDRSGMDLTNVLKFCGMEDNRQAHNALEDCKLTGECFSRLIYGKNLFPEYAEYKISEVLIK